MINLKTIRDKQPRWVSKIGIEIKTGVGKGRVIVEIEILEMEEIEEMKEMVDTIDRRIQETGMEEIEAVIRAVVVAAEGAPLITRGEDKDPTLVITSFQEMLLIRRIGTESSLARSEKKGES